MNTTGPILAALIGAWLTIAPGKVMATEAADVLDPDTPPEVLLSIDTQESIVKSLLPADSASFQAKYNKLHAVTIDNTDGTGFLRSQKAFNNTKNAVMKATLGIIFGHNEPINSSNALQKNQLKIGEPEAEIDGTVLPTNFASFLAAVGEPGNLLEVSAENSAPTSSTLQAMSDNYGLAYGAPVILANDAMPTNYLAELRAGTPLGREDDLLLLTNTVFGYAASAGAVTGLATVEENSHIIQRRQVEIRRKMRSPMLTTMGGEDGIVHLCEGGVDLANSIWASPFQVASDQQDKDDLTGYEYDMTGFAVGYDRIFGPLCFGAAFTFSKGDFDWLDSEDDNSLYNYGGSFYAQYYHHSRFFANLDGGFNYGSNKWKRYLGDCLRDVMGVDEWEQGDNHTNSFWLGGSTGYDFHLNCATTLTPSIGLYWYEARSNAYDSYATSEPENWYMRYGSYKQRSLLMPLEIAVEYNAEINACSRIMARASGGYTYNFLNQGANGTSEISGENFSGANTGMKSARHAWKAEAGVKFRYKQFDFGLDYRYEGAKKYRSHGISISGGARF